ncbi:MAG: transglycosylase domain-containing protein [Caldilineaceae bacterium]|nr:transglycosylase domain-containing protein [Caldilineaceae bacterium]
MPGSIFDRRTPLLLLLLLTIVLAGCGSRRGAVGRRPAISLAGVAEAYMQLYQPGPVPRVFQTTFLYDRNGRLLAELIGEGRREWASLDRISPYLINATIATEDATFFTNPGVDPVRIAGAALQNVEQGEIVSGASTITMQLARNLFLGSDERYDQTFDRKIAEVGLASELTRTYAKEEILELYLNLLNYGHLAYGPQAAARTYFGKPAAELNLAEATLIAGIPQSPARFDLFADPESAKERQRTVLSLMVRHGFLTLDEANAAFAAEVELGGSPEIHSPHAPHFVDYVVLELDKLLGQGFVRRAGLHIYTTLDLALQEKAQQIVSQQVAALQPRFGMNNGALIALKPGTAEILAMVGSVDYKNKEIDGQVNVAISPRQPGSAIKPLLYATAFNDNLISPATVIWDTPITYTISTIEQYRPVNYDRKFHGPVTVRTALANSYNVPAIKLLDAVSVERLLESARKMGVESLHRGTDWYGLSLTLGGGEVTLLDLASAYHTIANHGRYQAPQFFLTITDGQGQTLREISPTGGAQAISEEAASLVTDILSDDPARVPMFGARSQLTLSRPVAAKTGTTDNNRDAWTMGFTRHLLTGVWVGNTDGRPMLNATGAGAAAPVWNEFMRTVLAEPDLLTLLQAPATDTGWAFQVSENVQRLEECPPGLTCRTGGGEIFSATWLDAAGRRRAVVREQDGNEEGDDQESSSTFPLVDSVEYVSSAPVYMKRQTEAGLETRLLGYCGHPAGAERVLLALPDHFGFPQDSPTYCHHCWSMDGADVETVDKGRLLRDRKGALEWSLGSGFPVYLGRCDEMGLMADYTGFAVGIDFASAAALVSPEIFSSGQLSEVSGPGLLGPHRYILDRLWHDDQCPGQYVMGLAVDDQGLPLPGVAVSLTDAWDNTYRTVSKSGASDTGRFDFPIYGGDAPQRFTLQILDANGNPSGSPIVVPHRTDEVSNKPCHHLVVQRQPWQREFND